MAEQYTRIPNHLFERLNNLTGKTLYVYIILRSLLRYRKGAPISADNNIVILSYGKMLEKYGINAMTFDRAVKQLIEYGLVQKIPGRYGGRTPTQYRML